MTRPLTLTLSLVLATFLAAALNLIDLRISLTDHADAATPPYVIVPQPDGSQAKYVPETPAQPATAPSPQPSPPSTQPAPDPNLITVTTGQSWVAAVRAAKPGQTVQLAAGVYPEGLTDTKIRAIGVRIIGAGIGKTIIRPASGKGLFAWCWDDCSVEDLSIAPDKTTDDGVLLFGCHGVTLSRVQVERFRFNVSVQSATHGDKKKDPKNYSERLSQNIRIDGCKLFDSTPVKDSDGEWKDSSNLYADEVAGLQVTNSHLDRGGRGPAAAEAKIPADKAQRNHNFYCKPSCSNVVITGNVFSNASSHGLQARAGGVVSANWFIDNPIHLSFGLVNGEGPILVGGVSGVIQGNLFVGTRDLGSTPPQPRGYAVEISNTKDVTVSGNTFASDAAAPAGGLVVAAVKLDICQRKPDAPDAGKEIGVSRATFIGNSCTWPNGLVWRHPKIPAANVTVQANVPAADLAAARATVKGASR
jgi:hypothetical protein